MSQKRCRKCGAQISAGDYCNLECLRAWVYDRGWLIMGNGVGTVLFRSDDGSETLEQTVPEVYATLAVHPRPLDAAKIGIYEGEPN